MVHCCGMWTAVDDDFSQRLTHRAAVLEGDALQRVRLLDDVPDEGLIVPEAVAAGAPVALEGAPGVPNRLLLVEHEFRVIHVGDDLLKLQWISE